MHSKALSGRWAAPICAASAALAIAAACKSSTASGTSGATDGGGGIAGDAGQGAGTAADDVASGVRSAGEGIADAGAAAAQSSARARVSDAQIAAIAMAANKVDIDAAQAAKKTKNAEVRRFANDMIRDHTLASKQAAALVKRLGLTPEENEASRSLTQAGEDNLANLKTLKGKEFDKAYAGHEVAWHQNVLATFDTTVLPEVRNADFRSLLESVRAVLAEHLDHARALADSLSR